MNSPLFIITAAQTFIFQPSNFISSLRYMAIGMGAIFSVIGLIILSTALIGKMFPK